MSNGEPWEFFKTIENTAKRLEATEATAEENRAILLLTFALAFAAFYESAPHTARARKDLVMARLKKMPLSQQIVNALEEAMLAACDELERRG